MSTRTLAAMVDRLRGWLFVAAAWLEDFSWHKHVWARSYAVPSELAFNTSEGTTIICVRHYCLKCEREEWLDSPKTYEQWKKEIGIE